ncbi:MAG: hypothetical protein AB8H03_04695 [Saprospiraceae bacterium]
MKNTRFVIVLFFCLHLGGCYYDVEEELYPTIECSTTDLSFQADILPIIDNNCFGCHDAASNFGGVTLEGYDQLKTYVNNNELLGVIKHESGFSPMPKNAAKLLDCEIEKIEAWITNGAPNN